MSAPDLPAAQSGPADGLLQRDLPSSNGETPQDRDLVGHLTAIVVESWWDLDANGGRRFHEYFAERGIWDFGGIRSDGRDAIRRTFDDRRANGERTTLHVLSNFTGEVDGPDSATLRSYICVFGSDGLPQQAVSLPNLLGLMQDRFERQSDGVWLITHRVFRPMMYKDTDRVARGAVGL